MFMCQTIVTEIQGQESAVYSYKGNLLSFAKIINESQAKEFAEFMTEEFQRIGQLEDFIKPISDELGVVSQSQFNMPVFNKNNPTQIEERECLMLKFGENKTIIFVGNIYMQIHVIILFIALLIFQNNNIILIHSLIYKQQKINNTLKL